MFQNYASGGLKKDKRHNAFRNWEEEKNFPRTQFFMLKQDLSAKNNSVAVFGLLVVAENVV